MGLLYSDKQEREGYGMTVNQLRDELDHLVLEGYGDNKIVFNIRDLHVIRYLDRNPGVYAACIDRIVGTTTSRTDRAVKNSSVTAYPVIPDTIAELNKGARW